MTKLYADEALYALLCKYLLDEADTAERQWVDDWLKSDPDHPGLLSALEKLLEEQPHIVVTPADTERAWQSLNARMGGKVVTYRWRKWWAAAAVILFAAGAGLLWLTARNSRTQRFTGPVLAQLKDGTTVQLEEKAQLLVMTGFGSRQREVSLEGKAIFDVTPDATRPFIIKLGERTIKVLGTRFMVDVATGKKGALRIHVDTGQIMVTDRSSKDSVILSAGMLLEQQEEKVPFRIAAHVADATKQQLVFADTPLSEVLQTIEIIYHVNVSADAALLQLPVTATFTGETAENVLASIAFMTNAEIGKKDTVIILKKHEE
ncbi:FecR family protein [Chitinophaga ginsengisoli]|uniref:FecR family protein n=1 Tax=Chitinophaga ginsengisoli TaxID=363837 RepID=A0A2P8GHH9_9BACT|nr:FecR domain-containing protein [Chitinophaga ginsengisoli]PSL33429.1 FecR family protein [Chitinophaga ginsengisoli]